MQWIEEQILSVPYVFFVFPTTGMLFMLCFVYNVDGAQWRKKLKWEKKGNKFVRDGVMCVCVCTRLLRIAQAIECIPLNHSVCCLIIKYLYKYDAV